MVWKNDISLIRITENIRFDKNVQPIALPISNFDTYNKHAIFTGWGLNKVIKLLLFCIKWIFFLQSSIRFKKNVFFTVEYQVSGSFART